MPVKIFFCYAREDEAILNKLKNHLFPLQRQGLIDTWYDRDISAGSVWEQEIIQHINEANIILLLVSPDFIASDYCYGKEMKLALERNERKETCVIPIILRPIYWQGILGNLQSLPKDAVPIIDKSWHSIDDALFNVGEGIRQEAMKLSTIPTQKEIHADVSIQGREGVVRKPRLLDRISPPVKIASIVVCLMLIFSVIFLAYERSGKFLTTSTSTNKSTAISTVHFLYQADWSKGIDDWAGEPEWTVSDGILAGSGIVNDNNAIIAPYQPKTADYSVEAQIKFLGAKTTSASALFGIFVRSGIYTDESGYDGYIIDNIAKIRKGAPQAGIILNQMNYPLDANWHTYQVEIKGSAITFIIDKKFVLKANDSSFTQPGIIGLFDTNSQINVRSFIVSTLDS